MPRTRKNTPSDSVMNQQAEPTVETISISDACKQLEVSEQAFRLALQPIRPDDFDSIHALALPEYEAVVEIIQRKALASAPQHQPEPQIESETQLQPEPQPQAEQTQPEPQSQQSAAPLAPQQSTPPAPVNEQAQLLQFVLTQQNSLSYSGNLKIEAAAAEGAATAYREFLANQQSYAATAQNLQQLHQALDNVRTQKSIGELSGLQQDFLPILQANSQNLQYQEQSHQKAVEAIKVQAHQHTNHLNSAILGAIQDLKNQLGDDSESSLL